MTNKALAICRLCLLFLPCLGTPLAAQANGDIRIVGIRAYDQGNLDAQDFAIDVVQDVCKGSVVPPPPEPFHDALLGITVLNDSNTLVRIKRIRLAVPRIGGKRLFKTRPLAPASIGEIASGSESEVIAFLAKCSDGGKLLHRSTVPIAADTGLRNVRVKLLGADTAGRTIRLTARTSLAFRNVDRCAR